MRSTKTMVHRTNCPVVDNTMMAEASVCMDISTADIAVACVGGVGLGEY